MKNTTKFSINLNKVALIRNSRGEDFPNLIDIARLAIKSGCDGITIHPRADKRHATLEDVKYLSQSKLFKKNNVELNIEGDLRNDLIKVLLDFKVQQFTVVPVTAGEKTTTRGWKVDENSPSLKKAISLLKPSGIRISLFVEPNNEIVDYAHHIGVDAVEFHTKWYAKSFGHENEQEEINKLKKASKRAKELNLKVHLGHDLNLKNLPKILYEIQPDEVSIGHALIAESIIYGLPNITEQYKKFFTKYLKE